MQNENTKKYLILDTSFEDIKEKLLTDINYFLSVDNRVKENLTVLITMIYGLYKFEIINLEEYQELHSLITDSLYDYNKLPF